MCDASGQYRPSPVPRVTALSVKSARAQFTCVAAAILSQRQWLAAELKSAEANDFSVTPPKDLKQRVAQRAVSPGGHARVWKPPVVLRRGFPPVELPPAQTQAVETGTRPSQQPLEPVATHTRRAGLGCLLAAALLLSAAVQALAPDGPPRHTDVAEGGRLYGPLITAGDAAVLSAQGVLRLCKEEKRCAAAREHLSHLTPTQRRKLGGDVAIWLASLASLALPSAPLAVLGRAPTQVLAKLVTALRSALFASRAPPAAASFATVAMGGAAKASVGASAARAAAAAAATKAGVATLPASMLGSPAAAKTNHVVLELTRRFGAKCLLLDVPLPSAANPVMRRVLASFPGLAY